METISKYIVSIVSVAFFCILIIGSKEVAAEGSEWVGKGDALNKMGNFSGAIMAYDKALEIDPNYVNAWDGKGWSLNELGNYTQAIVYLDKALKIDPNHLDALVFKAQALYNIGNNTGAKYYSNKAFEVDPKSPALKRLPEVLVRKVQ
jgi:tetratricopeptide (TPR) repeat protein